jgi:tetratricopeptide (TPR) repeat protein
VADIFVSYTSSDRDWAFWIGQELEKLGHVAHVHEWEISAGGDIVDWMEERTDEADQMVLVISKAYLGKAYSSWERRSAQWAARTKRPNFALPVRIEECELPILLDSLKRCDLFDIDESTARMRLAAFMEPAARPKGPAIFPGVAVAEATTPISGSTPISFPGASRALSNIPISVPRYFLGREDELVTIEVALKRNQGRVAITALHGLRGVGKSTLAVAFADRNAGNYRATWWISAETIPTMRADIVGLGVRLGWVAADEKEDSALASVLEHLRNEGEGILLIYDNANNVDEIDSYIPHAGPAHIIITSNAPNWRSVATSVEIEVWPNEIGADYLIERTGRGAERDAALALSEALGGLPLAHEQAAAYCERLEVSFAIYHKRYNDAPVDMLDDPRDAPRAYHNRLTAAKTFALAIDEAAKLHPAAEQLIKFAALLAPEPIPLFLFSEAREEFGEPIASNLAGDGLDEAVAALRAFALIDREVIPDEREPSITTDCVRLHRLVREVGTSRHRPEEREQALRILIGALSVLYPGKVWRDPDTWPRVRRLDAFALALVGGNTVPPKGAEQAAANLLIFVGQYKQSALAAYVQAKPLFERALAIREELFGPEHPETVTSLLNLGNLLREQGDLSGARPYLERALAISEKALGPDDPDTATSLGNLGAVLRAQGDLASARTNYERSLAIREKALGPDHPDTAKSINNLAYVLKAQGDLVGARPYYERALTISEKALGASHPLTKIVAGNMVALLEELKSWNEAKALRKKFSVED